MTDEVLDRYRRASDWTVEKVAGAVDHLDQPSVNEGWDVRTLLNHMLQTQQYFVQSARGEDATPPMGTPPDLIGDDPVATFRDARDETIETYGAEGVIEKTGPALGIAFSDTLLHGWDLARSTGQDSTMPDDLAQAAYDTVHGRFTEEQRKGVFKPEIALPPGASAQERLLAYTGRQPE
jgi:uncharacterized protein (TIGR03086 family)